MTYGRGDDTRPGSYLMTEPREVQLCGPSLEPRVVWRKWTVQEDDCLLRSIFQDTVWMPRERMEARCLKNQGPLTLAGRQCLHAPMRNCSCGIYATFERSELGKYGSARKITELSDPAPRKLIVIGTVSVWGKIVECETGLKAEYAYPYELFVMRPISSFNLQQVRDATDIAKKTAAGLRQNYLVDAGWQ